MANAFPNLCHALIYYFAYGMRNVSKDYSFSKIVSLMKQGIKTFKKG